MAAPELVAQLRGPTALVPAPQLLAGLFQTTQASEGLGESECQLARAPAATGGGGIGPARRHVLIEVPAVRATPASSQPEVHHSAELDPVVRIGLEHHLALEARDRVPPIPA